ncbi:MAG TPA: extracellular solute-binding protein [Erysipelothrix sp.]
MKNIKKIAVILLALLVVVGCGKKSGGTANADIVTEVPEGTKVVYWHAMNGKQEEALTKLTEDFNAANPNITVELQNQSSYKDLSQKLSATFVSPKDLPTMTQAYPGHVYNAILDDLVEVLDPYIEHDVIGIEDWEDVVKGYREGTKIDGKTYAIPFNKSTEVIFYNKDIFEKAGVEVPTNMEELAEVAKKIHETTGNAGAGFDSLSNYYITALASRGIEFNKDLDVTGKDSREIIDYYLEGVKEGYFRIAGEDGYLSGPFGNELLGFNIGSNAGLGYVLKGAQNEDGSQKFEVGAAVLPVESNIQQGTDLYIFSSATPEEKTAAFEYMKFLISKDSQIFWANTTGYIPVRTSAIESDEYQNSGNIVAPLVKEATKNMYTRNGDSATDSAANEVGATLEAILGDPNGDVDAKLEELKLNLDNTWE